MEPTPVFTERQLFLRHWWWLPLLIMALGMVLLTFSGVVTSARAGLLGVLLPGFLVVVLCILLRLDTRVDSTGITYRMFPLGKQHVPWADLKRIYVRQYSPLREYGGWGMRGLTLDNRALNVSGSQGLQLVLHNGRRLLLGTQRPEELRQALMALGYPDEPVSAESLS